jgi:hypothetical protein
LRSPTGLVGEGEVCLVGGLSGVLGRSSGRGSSSGEGGKTLYKATSDAGVVNTAAAEAAKAAAAMVGGGSPLLSRGTFCRCRGEDLATAACTQPLSACNCGDNPDLKAERVQ